LALRGTSDYVYISGHIGVLIWSTQSLEREGRKKEEKKREKKKKKILQKD